MKEEKIIVPANGYTMLFTFLVLFIGGIASIILFRTPHFFIGNTLWNIHYSRFYYGTAKQFESTIVIW